MIDPHAILASPTFDLGGFARALILSLIRNEPDDEEREARIEIALRDGNISQAQADDLRAIRGVR